jgi:hypothetical protein
MAVLGRVGQGILTEKLFLLFENFLFLSSNQFFGIFAGVHETLSGAHSMKKCIISATFESAAYNFYRFLTLQ